MQPVADCDTHRITFSTKGDPQLCRAGRSSLTFTQARWVQSATTSLRAVTVERAWGYTCATRVILWRHVSYRCHPSNGTIRIKFCNVGNTSQSFTDLEIRASTQRKRFAVSSLQRNERIPVRVRSIARRVLGEVCGATALFESAGKHGIRCS